MSPCAGFVPTILAHCLFHSVSWNIRKFHIPHIVRFTQWSIMLCRKSTAFNMCASEAEIQLVTLLNARGSKLHVSLYTQRACLLTIHVENVSVFTASLFPLHGEYVSSYIASMFPPTQQACFPLHSEHVSPYTASMFRCSHQVCFPLHSEHVSLYTASMFPPTQRACFPLHSELLPVRRG